MNIFVGSLSFKTTEERLRKEFEEFGEVESVKIILDQATLKSRGFAFVTMPDQIQAQNAIAGMNGKEVDGFTLKVNEARPKEARGQNWDRSSNYNRNDRVGSNYNPGAGFSGSGRDRASEPRDSRGNNIYDSKDHGRRGRGDGGRGSKGRSGGGRRSF